MMLLRIVRIEFQEEKFQCSMMLLRIVRIEFQEDKVLEF